MLKEKRVIQTSEIGYNYQIRPVDLINLIQDVEGQHIDKIVNKEFASSEAEYAIVLNFRYLEIKKWPVYKDVLEVVTFPYETTPFYGYRNTIIYDESHTAIIESYCLGTFIRRDNSKPYRMSKESLASIGRYPKYDMVDVGRKINLEREFELISETLIQVQPSHIDYFQHLNNAFYVEFASNQLPLDFKFSKLFVEHRFPFQMYDTIKLVTKKSTDSYVVIFYNDQDKIHAVFEFKI